MALCLTVALSACGLPPNVVVLVPDEAGSVGEISVAHAKTDELSVPYSAEATDAGTSLGRVFRTDEKTVDAAFAGALADTPRKPANFVIFFVSGKTELDARSAGTLNAAIKAGAQYPVPRYRRGRPFGFR
ncbi:MAG TPA: hypothetical protein VGM32_20790, partial [Rhodopila sp.]